MIERSGEAIDPASGLTPEETIVSDHLVEAVNAFSKLDRRHPSELDEFVEGIHRCQNQLAWRIVQRTHPEAWPVKGSSQTAPVGWQSYYDVLERHQGNVMRCPPDELDRAAKDCDDPIAALAHAEHEWARRDEAAA